VGECERGDDGGGAGAPPAITAHGGHAVGYVQVQVETLLATQWHGHGVPDAARVAEKRLLLAVLEEAVATVQRYVVDERRRGRRLYREAEAWVLSDDVSWPCAFRNICDALGIDPDYLREGVMRWSARRRARVSDGHQHYKRLRRIFGSRTRISNELIGAERSKASGFAKHATERRNPTARKRPTSQVRASKTTPRRP
jgi:hypothetical protein